MLRQIEKVYVLILYTKIGFGLLAARKFRHKQKLTPTAIAVIYSVASWPWLAKAG